MPRPVPLDGLVFVSAPRASAIVCSRRLGILGALDVRVRGQGGASSRLARSPTALTRSLIAQPVHPSCPRLGPSLLARSPGLSAGGEVRPPRAHRRENSTPRLVSKASSRFRRRATCDTTHLGAGSTDHGLPWHIDRPRLIRPSASALWLTVRLARWLLQPSVVGATVEDPSRSGSQHIDKALPASHYAHLTSHARDVIRIAVQARDLYLILRAPQVERCAAQSVYFSKSDPIRGIVTHDARAGRKTRAEDEAHSV